MVELIVFSEESGRFQAAFFFYQNRIAMKKLFYVLLLLTGVWQCRQADPPALTGPEAREIALEAQTALGQTLKAKLQSEGAVEAIGFCNVNAIPITKRVAETRGVRLKRVTDRPRNPENQATPAEIAMMLRLQEAPDTTRLQREDMEGIHYYTPIYTANLCMQCHGQPGTEIPQEVLAVLAKKYPTDAATGYMPGELRGLWKITLPLTDKPRQP